LSARSNLSSHEILVGGNLVEKLQKSHFSTTVKPVTAQHVRLNILEAIDVPTIWEVQLYAPWR
jgi:hypothetical protein